MQNYNEYLIQEGQAPMSKLRAMTSIVDEDPSELEAPPWLRNKIRIILGQMLKGFDVKPPKEQDAYEEWDEKFKKAAGEIIDAARLLALDVNRPRLPYGGVGQAISAREKSIGQ